MKIQKNFTDQNKIKRINLIETTLN